MDLLARINAHVGEDGAGERDEQEQHQEVDKQAPQEQERQEEQTAKKEGKEVREEAEDDGVGEADDDERGKREIADDGVSKAEKRKRRLRELVARIPNPRAYWRNKKEAKMFAMREACIAEFAMNEAIDKHWKAADVLLRQQDAKDSIFELERIRKQIIARFEDQTVFPLESSFPAEEKRTRSDNTAFKAELSRIIKPVQDHGDVAYLKRMYYAATVMDMYKRHNKAMRKELRLKHRESYAVKRDLRAEIARLEEKVSRAQSEKWCMEQIKLFEPHRHPHTSPKPEGVKSCYVQTESGFASTIHGMVRHVESFGNPTREFQVSRPGHVF